MTRLDIARGEDDATMIALREAQHRRMCALDVEALIVETARAGSLDQAALERLCSQYTRDMIDDALATWLRLDVTVERRIAATFLCLAVHRWHERRGQ